jgi:menaquinone-dependent protoporphyrinogen IX oxidase
MKGIIVYKSKYGSTKQFSEWLREDTGFDLFDISTLSTDLGNYEMIVIGSSIHGGQISLRSWIIQYWELFKDKSVVLMLTSGTSDNRFIQKTMEKSFPEIIRNGITLFPVGGRYIFSKMSMFDRLIIRIVASLTKHPAAKKGMLTERDEVNRDGLKELVDFIKSNN